MPWSNGTDVPAPKIKMLMETGVELTNYCPFAQACLRFCPTLLRPVATEPPWADIVLRLTPCLSLTGTPLPADVFRFCSPSRSTFMTGRYPYHIGQQTGMNLNPMPGVACGINLKYDFIAKVLSRAGYRTAALGKWAPACCLPSLSTHL